MVRQSDASLHANHRPGWKYREATVNLHCRPGIEKNQQVAPPLIGLPRLTSLERGMRSDGLGPRVAAMEFQPIMNADSVLVVATISDDPFAIDVAHYSGQGAETSDLISLKQFANSEFCPRFISDERDFDHIGNRLAGKTVVIVSTCCGQHTRNSLAMRTFLVARAAKDNGAERVILVQPDLFFSAQDRGPRAEHGETDFVRDLQDLKKFDGQPFSTMLYAELLRISGVDGIVTVHNHSTSVQKLCRRVFEGEFFNLCPSELFASYIMKRGLAANPGNGPSLILCAPDAGAVPFVRQVGRCIDQMSADMLLAPSVNYLFMEKKRDGERRVAMAPAGNSPTSTEQISGCDIIVFDDMVRTGSTIVECCNYLKAAGAGQIIFILTHFYSSDEVKENLNTAAIDEIVTTNTLPTILNRDMQGRLRKKMLVLKIEKWIANFIQKRYMKRKPTGGSRFYAVDISSKNPRAPDVARLY